jgi:teichoic acid transport system ATP-binding protein
MDSNIAIEARHASKIYELRGKQKGEQGQKFYALKDLNFSVQKGEVVGVLGTNGSGKSTISIILAGICDPDEGEIKVNGSQALIAINTGLNQQLTGMENIELKGALLGLTRSKIEKIKAGVIEFAEIGDFLYQPVKTYSSGMKSRLGFSINLCLDPEIMIVDEALSVGDKGFAQKCINKMKELRDEGKTIIFISHNLKQVRDICDTAMWIEGGMLREYGDIDEVCDRYAQYVDYYNNLSGKDKKKERDRKFAKRIIKNSKQSFFDKLFAALKTR